MSGTAHLDPQTAEDLHDGADGDTANGWTRIADRRDGSGRWLENRTLIVRDSTGATWGLPYRVGLTEGQEHEFPWRDTAGPCALTRLYPHTVTHTVYRTRPVEVSA